MSRTMSDKKYLHFVLTESQTISMWFEVADNFGDVYVSYDDRRKYNGFFFPAEEADRAQEMFDKHSWLNYEIADEAITI